MDDRLFSDPLLARFYDLDNGWDADLEYCLGLARDARSVLDLGCGTGLLGSRLAAGRTVVGVDPATAMLEIARRRPGGDQVTWIEADARGLKLDRRFDLIVMTGHAFQVFLTDRDQASVVKAIADHLAPSGRFIFDTRNPRGQAWRRWTPDLSRRVLQHPELGEVEAWNDAVFDPGSGIATYHTCYRMIAGGRVYSADSRIRFTSRERIEVLLAATGLVADAWLGDWKGNGYAAASPEIIPLGRLA